MRRLMLFVSVIAIARVGVAQETNWPRWRGPSWNGAAQGAGYPTNWSDTENVAWKAALPGWGTSTPAVWGDRIFVTCQEDKRNALKCLDFAGETLWTAKFGEERAARHRKSSGSNPSPTTDGERVYAYYKSGDLACVDFSGKTIWVQNLQELYGEDRLWWDLATSPVLVDNSVVIACIHGDSSYVAAFDKRSGKAAWKRDRNFEVSGESAQSYTTPLIWPNGAQQQIIVLGADHVTAHDAATGKQQWRIGGLNPDQRGGLRSVASPFPAGGNIVVPYARGNTLTAIRPGGTGDITRSHVAWFNDEFSSDVPTPAVMDGRIYVCGDRGRIACLGAHDGKVVWIDQLEQSRYQFSASPVIADGRLHLTREDGVTFVLRLGDGFDLIETNSVYEWTLATPVFASERILIRTAEHLYCIKQM